MSLSKIIFNLFFQNWYRITLDPDPNWAKILDPDPNSMYLHRSTTLIERNWRKLKSLCFHNHLNHREKWKRSIFIFFLMSTCSVFCCHIDYRYCLKLFEWQKRFPNQTRAAKVNKWNILWRKIDRITIIARTGFLSYLLSWWACWKKETCASVALVRLLDFSVVSCSRPSCWLITCKIFFLNYNSAYQR